MHDNKAFLTSLVKILYRNQLLAPLDWETQSYSADYYITGAT